MKRRRATEEGWIGRVPCETKIEKECLLTVVNNMGCNRKLRCHTLECCEMKEEEEDDGLRKVLNSPCCLQTWKLWL